MLKFLRNFRRDQKGVTAIEYGLIAALIGVAIIGGAELLGGSLNDMFTSVGEDLDAAVGGGAAAPAPAPAPAPTP